MATFVVVDDSIVARSFLKAVLLENGHEILAEGSNGEEGYELYAKHRPDIITLDIAMPGVNGMECLKQIKSEFPSAKVIMITSIGKESKKAQAIIEGAIDYFVKPFDPEMIMNSINKCLKPYNF